MSEEKSRHPAGRRRLTADEEHLWSTVARSVKPLRSRRRVAPAGMPKEAAVDMAPPVQKKSAVQPRLSTPHLRSSLPPPPAVIARRDKQQLARGKATIDGRIDLHGLTQAEAHTALLRFLLRSQAGGAKFVLVITGKGAPDAPRGERGVLRRQVPLWLGLPEFRACVLGFDVAHIGHGGEGALYVRLRRQRS